MREKLIELISETPCTIHKKIRLPAMFVELAVQRIADHLIANGVTIPVQCECCRYGIPLQHSDNVMCHGNKMPKDGFCSCGERKNKNENESDAR